MRTGAGNDLLCEVADGIATVTLNRPERRNALSVAVANGLYDLWEEIDRRPEIRCVVLTSADCGTFCAGMDLKEAAEIKARDGVDVLTRLKDGFHRRMRKVKAPIVAAMTGSFAAGGMLLSLNADLRVGLAGTRGAITEVKIGRGSPWAAPLVQMLPQAILMELVLTGEWLPVERFHALGFVNYVEPTPEAVRARARALAETIRDNAPLSVKAAKASVLGAMSEGAERGLDLAEALHRTAYASWDAIEGPRAFAEKRKPRFEGR